MFRPTRAPYSPLIFVFRDTEWHAYVARYGEVRGGTLTIEVASNATELESSAWEIVDAQGGWQFDAEANRFEFACPPDLASQAEFPTSASPLAGYRTFVEGLIPHMPQAMREFNLKPGLALSRIKALPLTGDWTRPDHTSDIVLMQEYLRRAAVWAAMLNVHRVWPFFSVAAAVMGDSSRPDHLFQKWKEHEITVQAHWEFMTQWATYVYLHWSTVAKQEEVRQFGLAAPYEPLIRLLERGGAFRRGSDGMVEVGGREISPAAGGIDAYADLPAWEWLDDSTLDWLDRVAVEG